MDSQLMSHDNDGFIKLVDGWGETQFGPNMSWIDTTSRFALEKIARATGAPTTYIPPSLRTKIAEIQGTLPKDKVAFYNRALGAFESYGVNRNGDGWFKNELVRKHATFVDNAKYFRHHANKDTDPFFGRPIASAFNDRTNMVDLIILADLDKQAEEDIQRLERGQSVWTSMGCKVKFDVCTICSHNARNRGEYCEHVKEAAVHPFGMCAVLTDGRVCGVMNPDPVFFDISRVTNPAFHGSENLLKVASSASMRAIVISSAKRAEDSGLVKKTQPEKPVAPKTASLGNKLADMIKELPGRIDGALVPTAEKIDALAPTVAAMSASTKRLSPEVLKDLCKRAGVSSVLSTATALGMVLSPEEFSVLADGAIVAAPTPQEILAAEPSKTAMAVLASPVAMQIVGDLSPHAHDRSFLQPLLLNKIASHRDDGQRYGLDAVKNADKVASAMYVQYRAALLSGLRSTDYVATTAATKLAGTANRYVTPSSSAFALLAFCRDAHENHGHVAAQILAKESAVADTLCGTLRVSGSMADDFGEDVLELMADNFLQKSHRS